MSAALRDPEVYAFGPFRLEVRERRLLRGDEAVPLRAKVFDTLVVLVRNAGRLVERGDLLEAVWPRAIVEESNLNHNVSALRRVLRTDDGAKLIETVPRRGYRFIGAVRRLEAAAGRAAGSEKTELERARRAFESGAWSEAYDLYLAAGGGELPASDQARLAWAARWAGHFDELVPLLENASAAFRREGDADGTARMAVDLAITLLERRRPTLAKSYLRQAERYLPETPEPGSPSAEARAYLGWVRHRLSWSDGDWAASSERARELLELARELDVIDVEALAHGDLGHTLLAQGRYAEAAASLEEAAAIAMGGELGLFATGIVLCGLIIAWRTSGRLELAAEWTDVYSRWSDREGVAYFPGMCRIHRGELMCMRGDLERAEKDLEQGSRELALADSSLAATGFRELGLVQLRRGDLAGAEQAFRRAMEFGIEPEPGLALLRAARGEVAEARRALQRFVADDGERPLTALDRENRVPALAALVPLSLETGDLERARAAAAELRSVAEATGSAMHRAAADQAEGAILLHRGRPGAVELLCRSVYGWSELDTPYECGLARELLSRAYVREGDVGRARMELQTAATTFERLGAELDRLRIARRLDELAPRAANPARSRVLVCGQVADAERLRNVIGEAAWKDLESWLDRRLHVCWRDHGGTALDVPDGYAVSFERLEDSLRCVRYVQRSLREHRAQHGLAPPLRVGVVDTDALPEGLEGRTALDLARSTAASGRAGEVTVLTARTDVPDLSGAEPSQRRLAGDERLEVLVLRDDSADADARKAHRS